MEPTPVGQVNESAPTVTYDQGPSNDPDHPVDIHATVIILPPLLGSDEIRWEFPMICVPGSGSASIPAYYAVTWILVDGDDAFSTLEFEKSGITDSGPGLLPPGLEILHSERVEVTPSQWRMSLKNQVSTTSALEYKLHICYQLHSEPNPSVIPIDPTIVVTMEPID
jgi:hypothetical protein